MFQDSWQSSATHALDNTFIFKKQKGCLQNTADLDSRYYLTFFVRSPCLREPELNSLLQLGMAVLPNHRVYRLDVYRYWHHRFPHCYRYRGETQPGIGCNMLGLYHRGSPNFTELLSIMSSCWDISFAKGILCHCEDLCPRHRAQFSCLFSVKSCDQNLFVMFSGATITARYVQNNGS